MKRYIEKIKKDPNQLFFDIYNTAVLIFAIGAIIAIIQWMARIFNGEILLNPIAISVGGVDIYWYGIIFAMAFLFGFLVIIREARILKLNIDKVINMVFWTVVFGFLGARLIFTLLNWVYYISAPLQILNIWQGGLSLLGGIAGGGLFLIIYSFAKKENVWKTLDLFAPAILIGQVIGRWGNFFNQEYFGAPSNYLAKMYVSPMSRPWELRSFAFFHPLFLYESILCLLLFVALVVARKKKDLTAGAIFLFYILGYSIIRFFIELLSIEPRVFLNLTLEQLISALIAAIVILILIVKGNKKITKKRKQGRKK